MSSKAYVKDDWMHDGVAVAILRERHGRRELLTWSPGEIQTLDESGTYADPDPSSYLHIQEDDARALYEALADHFGHAGHDIRALRKDYESERGRVDRLIGAVIKDARA
jgi:hypothetical protein